MQEPKTVHALGFTRECTSAVSTLHLVSRELDVEEFERDLRKWELSEWPDLFDDPLLASAWLDRLADNACTVAIAGTSYRVRR